MENNYREEKIENGLTNLKKYLNDLDYLDYRDLKDRLWKLEREAALLRKFITDEVAEDEFREVI